MSPPEAATEVSTRKRALLAVGATLALAVAGSVLFATGIWRPFGRVEPPEHVRLAVASTPHAALLHLAAAKGYFEDEGLSIKLIPVSHGKAALELLSNGQTDLAAAAEVPFVIAVLQGEPFGLAASMLSVSTEMAIVARRDRGIAQPADLVGKRIGVTKGTSGEYFLWAFLIRHKLLPDSVVLVDLAPGRLAGELAQGNIDAASTWQPVRLNAESALGSGVVSFTAPAAYTVTHVVVGRNDYLKSHPRAARRLVRALLKAEEFNRRDPQKAASVVAIRLNLDPAFLSPGWGELSFRVNLLQSHLVTLEDEARWAMTRGHAPQQAIPNFLPHLYLDALMAEQPERVTVVH
jgi:ABC-type nitrate/sulfonate/bicarbonate transport system substrate-binding protein